MVVAESRGALLTRKQEKVRNQQLGPPHWEGNDTALKEQFGLEGDQSFYCALNPHFLVDIVMAKTFASVNTTST